ncbi:MAG: hypothetical protein ATN35_08570 [Epulopiscium sp. Nele67-Bin004]|nr:MAG: hypothetical protein ATN35_08570 [Epulopiscium sp. Nele67-Bin004]
MIEQSRKALFEMLNEYAPTLVIVWGRDWSKILSWLPDNERNWIDGDLKLWKYSKYPDTWFWNIKHPAMAFSYNEHYQKFQKVKSYL